MTRLLAGRLFRAAAPVAFVLLAVAGGCGSDELMEDDDESRKQVVSGYVLTQTELGLRDWRLEGCTASYVETDSMVLLSGVELTFFELDEPSTVLTGDSGEIREGRGLMRVWGDVEVQTVDGRHLATEELTWAESTGTFETDCVVVLTIQDSLARTVLSGRGARLSTDLGPGEEGVDIYEGFRAVYSGEVPE